MARREYASNPDPHVEPVMISDRSPKVSIGLPVRNGERFLAQAINSIIAQTFTDFELILCDNASTDQTSAICRSFAERDPRVRYYRNERDLGAAPNFNLAFSLARGVYFKWASHDDVLVPEFIEASVAALDRDPTAVQCQSLVRIIDEDGYGDRIFDSRLLGADSPRAPDRFSAIALHNRRSTDIFGLMRSDSLAKTRLLRSYPRSDDALLAELALLGIFVQVKRPLFLNRYHPERYSRSVHLHPDRFVEWYDTSKVGTKVYPTWFLLRDYVCMIKRHLPRRIERLQCYVHVCRWFVSNWNFIKLPLDLVGNRFPRVVMDAHRIKRQVFGNAKFRVTRDEGTDVRAVIGSGQEHTCVLNRIPDKPNKLHEESKASAR